MIQQFASEGSLIYLPKLGSTFSRTKTFCFENDVFLALGLGMRVESVRAREVGKGESHSRPYHVDIQVGSYICLNVIMLNHCMCT